MMPPPGALYNLDDEERAKARDEAYRRDEESAREAEQIRKRTEEEFRKGNHFDADFEKSRAMGTGFFRFSQDEDERQRQMANLNAAHEQTQKDRAAVDEKRKSREQLISDRVRKMKEKRDAILAQKKARDDDEVKQRSEDILSELL